MSNKSSKDSSSNNSFRSNGQKGGKITKECVEKGKQSCDTEALKQEIAEELGITPGASATASENGKIGGEMTKRLFNKGESASSSSKRQSKSN